MFDLLFELLSSLIIANAYRMVRLKVNLRVREKAGGRKLMVPESNPSSPTVKNPNRVQLSLLVHVIKRFFEFLKLEDF